MKTRRTIGDYYHYYAQQLRAAQIDTWQLDARIILAHALHCTQEYILTHPEKPIISKLLGRKIAQLMERRAQYEPIAHITGQKEFMGFDFMVNRHVLIPRPKSEELCDAIIKRLDNCPPQNHRQDITILDCGTGSGALIISLAKHLKNNRNIRQFSGVAIDKSRRALRVAQHNAEKLGVADNIQFHHCSIEKITKNRGILHGMLFDIIISNPPYISETDYHHLMNDVRLYEPKMALVAQDEGYYFYHLLAQIAHNNLQTNGVVFLECAPNQVQGVQQIFRDFHNCHIIS